MLSLIFNANYAEIESENPPHGRSDLPKFKYVGDVLSSMSEAQTVAETPGIARELTAFQQNILTILAEEPRYGLAVKRELETYYDDDVNHGRLYPNLDDLVEMGLVEKSELDKRTNQYALTEDGYEALLDQFAWSFDKLIVDSDRADDLEALVAQYR